MNPIDALRVSNEDFMRGAASSLFGPRWSYNKPQDADVENCDYIRTIRFSGNDGEPVNEYLFVIDIDGPSGLNAQMLRLAGHALSRCNKASFSPENPNATGFIKASGMKGVHIYPFVLVFDYALTESQCAERMKVFAEELWRGWRGAEKFGIGFGKSNIASIDPRMFERGRKVRGFCRRFDKDCNPTNPARYSVPVLPDDGLLSVERKVLILAPLSPISMNNLPRLEWNDDYLAGRRLTETARVAPPRPHSGLEVQLKNLDEMSATEASLYDAMPPTLKAIFHARDPSHQERFGLVAWANRRLEKDLGVVDAGERAAIISAFILKFMAMTTYRESGRISPDKTGYQVAQIVEKGYTPPGWTK